MKNTKEFSEVNYDISDLQVMTVDGALVKITEQSGSLLFFHVLPAITTKRELDENNSLVGRCLVELRMSKDTLNKIMDDIANNILAFDSEKQENQPKTMSKKDTPPGMFA